MTLLPLLQRELREKGGQPRTYALRVVYAVLLYGGAWLVFGDDLLPVDPARAGSGRDLFQFAVACCFAAVYVLIPAGLGTVLLRERQRGTYDLLVLAGMSTRRILAEIEDLKYHVVMDHYSRVVIEEALRRSGGNQTKAAELLGLQRTYLTRLIRQRGVSTKPPAQ